MQRRTLLTLAVAAGCAQPASVPSDGPSPAATTMPVATTSDVRLRIIATSDFHGALEPRPDPRGIIRGGGAHLAAMAERLRSECPSPCETLLLDGGDLAQGTPASNLAFGRPVYALFNAMGYAAAALGNHEFDWGQDTLKARMRDARFAILGANVRYKDGRDVEWIRNDTIVVRGPWKVGIIGIARIKTPEASKAENIVGLRFDPAAPVIDSTARALRARGANAVVVIAHEGAFCNNNGTTDCRGEIVDIANAVKEPIDAIVAGHTHAPTDAVINGIPIVQARSRGTAIATVDIGGGAPRAASETARLYNVLPDSIAPSPALAALVTRAVRDVAPITERLIAVFAEPMVKEGAQHPVGNFITDAQRAVGKGDIAVINNGGIRAGIPAGNANYGSFFEVHPFSNMLKRVTARGDVVRAYLERIVSDAEPDAHISGAVVEYDPARPAGSRILSVRMSNGRPLDDAAVYTVVLNDFMADGGDRFGFMGRDIRTESVGIADLDALIEYARTQSQPIRAPVAKRLIPVTR